MWWWQDDDFVKSMFSFCNFSFIQNFHSLPATSQQPTLKIALKFSSFLSPQIAPVVWFVSHCRSESGRDRYVRRLTQHIGVHIYGKAGGTQETSFVLPWIRPLRPLFLEFYILLNLFILTDSPA